MRAIRRYLHGRTFVIEPEPGTIIPGDLDDYIVSWCFIHGYDSEPAVRLSRALIQPGDVVIDVGSNIGLWLMGAARRALPSGQVHAFEPVEQNLSRLRHNLQLNGLDGVILNQLALSDHAGRTTFFLSDNGNSGMGGLASREGVCRAQPVELTTLDAYCADRAIEQVDFLKLDIEGAEGLVFAGGMRVLSGERAPAILFEADEELAGLFHSSTKAVKGLLASFGYEIFRPSGDRLERVAVDTLHVHEDLFAFKRFHFEQRPALSRMLSPA